MGNELIPPPILRMTPETMALLSKGPNINAHRPNKMISAPLIVTFSRNPNQFLSLLAIWLSLSVPVFFWSISLVFPAAWLFSLVISLWSIVCSGVYML
jgi:hypothetical protein